MHILKDLKKLKVGVPYPDDVNGKVREAIKKLGLSTDGLDSFEKKRWWGNLVLKKGSEIVGYVEIECGIAWQWKIIKPVKDGEMHVNFRNQTVTRKEKS